MVTFFTEYQPQATLPESSPLENVAQASCSNTNNERQIPLITIHPSSSREVLHFGETSTEHNKPETEEEAEQPAEKKGTMHALRK